MSTSVPTRALRPEWNDETSYSRDDKTRIPAVWVLRAGRLRLVVHRVEARVAVLEAEIRAHRDVKGDDRCWRDDEDLYRILPEGYMPPPRDSAG